MKVDPSSSISFNVVDRNDLNFSQLHRDGKFPVETINIPDFKVGLDLKEPMVIPGGPPLFAVQLTFIRGGVVLVVVFSHLLSDGHGIAGYLRRWFAAIRAVIGTNS